MHSSFNLPPGGAHLFQGLVGESGGGGGAYWGGGGGGGGCYSQKRCTLGH